MGAKLLPLCRECSGLHIDASPRGTRNSSARQESAPFPGVCVLLAAVLAGFLATDKLYTSLGEQKDGMAPGPNHNSEAVLWTYVTHRACSQNCPNNCVLCLQDSPGDNECVLELEGLEVVVEARVECEPPPDTSCHVTCQQHQVQTTGTWVGSGAMATA